MTETFVCTLCGETRPVSELHIVNDRELCDACSEDHTVVCSGCGERIMADDNYGDADTVLCHSCYDSYYTSCSHCGRMIPCDSAYYMEDDTYDEEPLCEDCYHDRQLGREIQNYYYKPDPIFHGNGTRYFGVELEIDGGGERDSSAVKLMGEANRGGHDHIYCKHDGSLEDGIELVTHPMTLKYHLEKMPWEAVLAKAVELGYLSHRTGTCGLHVHVNRDAFGDSTEEQDNVIAKILFFVENHWNEMLRFSRRTKRQMEQWAARYGRKDDPKAMLDHVKGCNSRYTCVNLTNDETIEFRMFRGTLKLNTFIATLQMVDRICDVALRLSDQELQDMPWSDFVIGCTAPELVQYLKERRLYVCEPVTATEEV